jgi:glucose-6-phosphate 1-dehydrogenase
VTRAESYGIGSRGSLYESLGVIRDVVQNHLLCVICLLSMEAPASYQASAFTDARAKVLKAAGALTQGGVLYGQYEGYCREDHVAPDSSVATFVALRLSIDSPRWTGVPFFVRVGKGMATTATQAVVVFKVPPPLPFSNQESSPEADRLVFRIGPSDGVDLLVQTKLPGEGVRLTTTPLTVDYDTVFGRIPLAYERVLDDTLRGDRSMFASEEAVEEAWRIVADVNDPADAPTIYPRGSWGPDAARGFLGEGRVWMDPA